MHRAPTGDRTLEIFTTRPDTLFGASFMGLSPDHPISTKLAEENPDLEAFIKAKSRPGQRSNFNMSVMVTDAFMQAVLENTEWELVWLGETVRRVKARQLWDLIMQQAYDDSSRLDQPVEKLMGPKLPTIGAGQSIQLAVEMLDGGGAALVLDGGRPVAVITQSDILQFLTSAT